MTTKQPKAKSTDEKKTVYIRLDKIVYDRIDQRAKNEKRSWSFVASRILEQGSQA
jgi:hypothetical protein